MKNEVKYETKNGRTVKKSETVDGVPVSAAPAKKAETPRTKNEGRE